MPTAADVDAVPESDEAEGCEYNDGGFLGPSKMSKIDMLLGRRAWLFGVSREARDGAGAFADCDREA